MKITAAVWGMFFIFGYVHIQAHTRTLDEEVRQVLRQSQGGRKPNQLKLKSRDDDDYVTEDEFNKAINTLTNEVNKVSTHVDLLEVDFRKVEATVNADNCAKSPCQNKGVCRNRLNGYDCLCIPGYGGANCENDVGPVVSKTIHVTNGNTEGTWNFWDMCPTGSFARTFRIKLEGNQGASGDDSAMNNINLYCHSDITGKDVHILESGSGPFGSWRNWQDCPSGKFLTGFKLKVEGDQGTRKDDSAVNGITMTCEGGSTVTGPTGTEGSFGSLASCPPNHAICGVSTRIEPAQGSSDDSSLNDVLMKCCAKN